MAIPVGIDLGTTFSAVACIPAPGEPPRVIRNGFGRAVTPSVVCFADGAIRVGDEARELQETGADAAAFFKRAMGDPSFTVELGGRPHTATDLSAHVLSYLRALAADHLGADVRQAVVTVPAYFNNLQRQATIQAGEKAGLEVLSIVNEPTAAARAYGLRPGVGGTVLVYDLGGGTFDVSLVRITEGEMRVVATGGDHNLGGKDWDDRLLAYLADRRRDDTGEELLDGPVDELLVRTEKLKRALSERSATEVALPGGGRYEVTRARFEELTRDLLDRTRTFCAQVLDDAGVRWDEVTGIVPVGGSTRMPMVRALLVELSGREPLAGVQPDEAVALGAAVQAADDLEAREPSAPRFFLPGRRAISDVMSHSLGMIAVSADASRYVNSILIRRNEPVPAARSRPYRLRVPRGRQGELEVFLTQGESGDPQDCVYLGRYVFSGVPAGTDPHRDLDVTYAYDRNGVVQVAATDRATGTVLPLAVHPLPDDVPARFAGAPPSGPGPATVYLVFDVSGSMSGRPLEEARRAARAFVAECDLGVMAVGAMAVSDAVKVLLPASHEARAVEDAVASLAVGMTGGGNGAHPFDELRRLLERTPGRRIAVVLADGVWSDQKAAVRQARLCHAAEIEVIGVGFGGADEAFLRDISSGDAGIFTDLSRLTETFSSIAQELGGGRLQVAG
jgi:molecular chaperone DnaK